MVTVLYDGQCVLCNQTRRTVMALDWLKRVEFLDIQQWDAVYKRYPQLDYEVAMRQMHTATPDGQLIGGFEGMRRLLRELPLGAPLWLLLHLPSMNWLGPRVYRFIARHRYRINRFFGVEVCEDGACKLPQ